MKSSWSTRITQVFAFSFIIFLIGCSKEKSDEKKMISFTIPNQTCDVLIDGSDVSVNVYKYSDISHLTPIVIVSEGATVNPPSGSTVDFTDPVTFTVTAQNGSTAVYIVTVNKNLSRRNDIENFQLAGTEQIFEREGDDLIIYVPYETDVTSIATEIAISNMATVSPESGILMDFTNPQTYTVTASDGNEKNFLVTVKRSPWRKVGNGPFAPRDEIGCLVFKDKIWVLAGWNSTDVYYYHYGDVWNTSNGEQWELILEDAPWKSGNTQRFVVFNDKIWAIGGGLSGREVWSSEDGVAWEKQLNEVPWGLRHNPYVAVFKDKLWLMGGHNLLEKADRTAVFNDVWSSDDGVNWVLEKDHAEWSPRGLIYGAATINDNLYLYGGGVYTIDLYQTYNDVWVTSNGYKWNRVVSSAEWTRRGFAAIASHKNKLWILGGGSPELGRISNEVWYSKSEGKTWEQVKYPFFKATHANGFISFNGKLWMVAGWYHNEVWVLEG